ncbi:YfiR family protein [Alicycliphilus denitrificans]|uniref:YfiR family protein n=1 Tax=Alicycliphilus denitrificans TaxID=179636 RepID=UPI00384B73B5
MIIQLSLAAMVLVLPAGGARAQPAPAPEYAVKSALLFKLPRFVYLPRLEGGTRISLCLLGKNPFGGALAKLAQTPIDGRSVQLRQPEDAAQALDCDFVFIARSEADQLKSILGRLGEAPVVTISDIDGFARAGGMVEMALHPDGGDSLNILINRRAAQAHRIHFNAQLLRLARIVEP